MRRENDQNEMRKLKSTSENVRDKFDENFYCLNIYTESCFRWTKKLWTWNWNAAGAANLLHSLYLFLSVSLCVCVFQREQEIALPFHYYLCIKFQLWHIRSIPVVIRLGRYGSLLTLINHKFLMILNYGIVFATHTFPLFASVRRGVFAVWC